MALTDEEKFQVDKFATSIIGGLVVNITHKQRVRIENNDVPTLVALSNSAYALALEMLVARKRYIWEPTAQPDNMTLPTTVSYGGPTSLRKM